LIKKKQSPQKGIARISGDEKRKMGLLIEFHDGKRDFQLSINYNIHAGRNAHHYRKAGNALEPPAFYSFFNAILNFLHDTENYSTNHLLLIEQFQSISEGESIDIPAAADWRADNSNAIQKITGRITAIEKRLIEQDTDSTENRIKMRGELEGLKFALTTIQQS
jgi:hypothetical protein